MDDSIRTALNPIATEISGLFKKKRGQFLIVGPDRTLLRRLEGILSGNTKYKPVNVTRDRHDEPDGKIFFLNLLGNQNIEYQSLLYYYLELPLNHHCFVCLISTSSTCLNTLEKRVRSRFKNRIFFVPYLEQVSAKKKLPRGTKDSLLDLVKITPSIDQRIKCEFMKNHGLENFTVSFILDLFEPVHFVLIIAAKKYKITFLNVLSIYRKITVNLNEIKGVENNKVLFCYYDLIDSGIISGQGSLMVDYGECYDFIVKNCPLYIRKITKACG